MSQDGIRALFDRVQSDDGFRERLSAAASSEQRRRLVAEAGYDVEAGDLPALRELAGLGELSDEELEQVAAGGSGTGAAAAFAAAVGGIAGGAAVGVGAALAAALAAMP